MTRTVGLLLAVALIWTSVEVYANGTGGAFGGRLAWLLGEGEATTPSAGELSNARRAGAAVERAHQLQQERYEDLLGED